MRKTKVDQIFKGIGEITRSKSKNKERKVLNLLTLEEIQTLFNQIRHLEVDQGPLNRWGRDQYNQLSVRHVEEIIRLRISHKKEVEQ